jgi:hypothetical protein
MKAALAPFLIQLESPFNDFDIHPDTPKPEEIKSVLGVHGPAASLSALFPYVRIRGLPTR